VTVFTCDLEGYPAAFLRVEYRRTLFQPLPHNLCISDLPVQSVYHMGCRARDFVSLHTHAVIIGASNHLMPFLT